MAPTVTDFFLSLGYEKADNVANLCNFLYTTLNLTIGNIVFIRHVSNILGI
jgi:hypothetical protein